MIRQTGSNRMNKPATVRTQSDFLASRGAVLDGRSESPLHFGDPSFELAAFSRSAALVSGAGASRMVHDGADALDLLHRLSTNDLLQLEPGRSALTVLTSERGRIIDVLNVACLREDRLLLMSESRSALPAVEWIERFTIIEDAAVRDVSGELAGFAVIGPAAPAVILSAFDVELGPGDAVSPAGAPENTVLVASNWALNGGELTRVDVVTPASEAEATWDRLSAAGASPVGEQAFHAKRISRAIPFPGSELTTEINPLEAGLKSLISFTKGCYVGQEVVARLDTYDKLQKRLAQLEFDRDLPAGAELTADGKRAGKVTSVSPLPVSGKFLALGYVRRGYWDAGTKLQCGEATVTVREVPTG